MTGLVSYYPQVSEWIDLGDTAINMAQVTSIEFGGAGDAMYAIVRLSSYRAEDDAYDKGTTWFKVTQPELVRYLRAYVDELSAPGFRPNGQSGSRDRRKGTATFGD